MRLHPIQVDLFGLNNFRLALGEFMALWFINYLSQVEWIHRVKVDYSVLLAQKFIYQWGWKARAIDISSLFE